MLAGSMTLFAMVSALVAFGAWPGDANPTNVDETLVTSIERPKPHAVAVRRDAGLASRSSAARAGAANGSPTTVAGTAPTHFTAGSGTTVASVPKSSSPATSAPTGGSGGGQTTAGSPVKTVTQPLLQSAPQPVQDVANQVDQVINQVGGSVPPPQSVANDTVTGVVGR